MTEEELQQKRKEQTNALYCAYGQFAVEFEHVCHAVHTAMIFMLHREGLRNQQVANVLLAGLTAEPLKNIFAALVAETQELRPQDKQLIDGVLKRFKLLIEQRNDIIHGTWFIGLASSDTTDFSNAMVFKHHRSNKGASAKSFDYDVDKLQSLTREAEALKNIFMRLHGCFIAEHPIWENFKIDANGLVSTPQ